MGTQGTFVYLFNNVRTVKKEQKIGFNVYNKHNKIQSMHSGELISLKNITSILLNLSGWFMLNTVKNRLS